MYRIEGIFPENANKRKSEEIVGNRNVKVKNKENEIELGIQWGIGICCCCCCCSWDYSSVCICALQNNNMICLQWAAAFPNMYIIFFPLGCTSKMTGLGTWGRRAVGILNEQDTCVIIQAHSVDQVEQDQCIGMWYGKVLRIQ